MLCCDPAVDSACCTLEALPRVISIAVAPGRDSWAEVAAKRLKIPRRPRTPTWVGFA